MNEIPVKAFPTPPILFDTAVTASLYGLELGYAFERGIINDDALLFNG